MSWQRTINKGFLEAFIDCMSLVDAIARRVIQRRNADGPGAKKHTDIIARLVDRLVDSPAYQMYRTIDDSETARKEGAVSYAELRGAIEAEIAAKDALVFGSQSMTDSFMGALQAFGSMGRPDEDGEGEGGGAAAAEDDEDKGGGAAAAEKAEAAAQAEAAAKAKAEAAAKAVKDAGAAVEAATAAIAAARAAQAVRPQLVPPPAPAPTPAPPPVLSPRPKGQELGTIDEPTMLALEQIVPDGDESAFEESDLDNIPTMIYEKTSGAYEDVTKSMKFGQKTTTLAGGSGFQSLMPRHWFMHHHPCQQFASIPKLPGLSPRVLHGERNRVHWLKEDDTTNYPSAQPFLSITDTDSGKRSWPRLVYEYLHFPKELNVPGDDWATKKLCCMYSKCTMQDKHGQPSCICSNSCTADTSVQTCGDVKENWKKATATSGQTKGHVAHGLVHAGCHTFRKENILSQTRESNEGKWFKVEGKLANQLRRQSRLIIVAGPLREVTGGTVTETDIFRAGGQPPFFYKIILKQAHRAIGWQLCAKVFDNEDGQTCVTYTRSDDASRWKLTRRSSKQVTKFPALYFQLDTFLDMDIFDPDGTATRTDWED